MSASNGTNSHQHSRQQLEPLLEEKPALLDEKNDKTDYLIESSEPIGYRPIPLDGGWGWMVVLGAFLIHVLADGFIYSFGVMSVQLIETFNEGRGLTSWIVSVMIGLYLGIGSLLGHLNATIVIDLTIKLHQLNFKHLFPNERCPIAGAMTDRYGCRATTFLGSLIATAGCAASYFATSILFLMGSVGVVMGIGFGLMYCPAIVIVTMYFERQRAFATGIAVCGAGVGTFIFAPLTQVLIEEYTWRGCFLIYAGVILNGTVCAMLFRPVQFAAIYAEDIIDEPSVVPEVQPQANGQAGNKMVGK